MIIEDAIRFVVEEVEEPALLHPELEDTYKNKVKRSKTIIHRIKRVGDLQRYLQRFETVPQIGDPNRMLYDRFKELGLKTYEDLYSEFICKFAQYLDDVTVIDDFVLGNEYTSWDISIFAQTYDVQSGIYLIGDEPNYQAIFVKSTFEEGKYPNQWIEPNVLLKYYMFSLKGVFNPKYKYNAAILNSRVTETPIYVFEKQGTRLTLKGIFQYESDHNDPTDGSAWFILKKINSLVTRKTLTQNEYVCETQNQVQSSKKVSKAERRNRLLKAEKLPREVSVTSKQFVRNPDVIVEVLDRANGVCERCHKPAPFIRASDLTPYLEVHHKKPLAEGGEDTVENAIALCPNCHRREHHAAEVITVSEGIIFDKARVLLALQKNSDNTDQWVLPNVEVQVNANPDQVLRRELKRKLEIVVGAPQYLGEMAYELDGQLSRYMIYLIKKWKGEPQSTKYESLKWVELNELDQYNLVLDKNILNRIKALIDNRSLSKIVHNKERFTH